MAIVQTAPECYELRELPLPAIDEDGALVEVESCGVCGTDLEVFTGAVVTPLPIVPGHEPVGHIAEIGDRARARLGVDVGDRVAIQSRLACGRCRGCHTGGPCLAPPQGVPYGYGFRSPDLEPGLWGGLATHLYLPAEALVVPVPKGLSPGVASLFNVFANAVEWVRDLGAARLGGSIAVLGCGPRGLACAAVAKACGLGPVLVTGLPRDRDRLDLARELGADHAVEVTTEGPVPAAIDALGHHPALVVDTTPLVTASVAHAVELVAIGGTVVLAGMKGDAPAPLPVDQALVKQVTLRGAGSKSLDAIETAVQLLDSSTLPLERLASHAFPLEAAADAVLSLTGPDRPVHARIEIGA